MMRQDHRDYYKQRVQAELELARIAGSSAAQAVHRSLAEAYAERVRSFEERESKQPV